MDEFLPPQNIVAERQILGAILIDENAIKHVKELMPEDFYKAVYGDIYKGMLALHELDEPIDIATLNERIPQHVPLCMELAREAVTSANIESHAKIVKELAQKRHLVKAFREGIAGINELSLDETISKLRNTTQRLLVSRGGKIISYKDLTKMTLDAIETRYNNKGILSGIPSGFVDIDDLTDGWQKADLIILAARPGMGKSAISQVFCEQAKVPCGIIQLEMGEMQTGIRSISRNSTVPLYLLRKGMLHKSDWPKLTNAAGYMAQMPIYLDFSSRKLSDIERTFTEMVEAYNIQFMVIDYLQLADADERNRSREQEVAATSKLLKHMAKAFKIPVLALAQLNRAIEKRENKKPMMSDLRESGQIEADADMIIFLYEEDAKEKHGVACLDFAKGRNIGLGTVKLNFKKDLMEFSNHTEQEAF